ncbi:MAG TPA: cupin domain-containing protein [Desulfuromonadales bacterium]|nr:cupin domain-containing protein [Desulfuromonadales bacterium]
MFVSSVDDIDKIPMPIPGASNVMKQLLVGRDEGWADHAMRLFTVGKGGHTPKHSHPWPHINYIVSGCGELLVDSKKHEVKAGSVAYVPDDVKHQFTNPGDEDFIFICIVPNRGEY